MSQCIQCRAEIMGEPHYEYTQPATRTNSFVEIITDDDWQESQDLTPTERLNHLLCSGLWRRCLLCRRVFERRYLVHDFCPECHR